ncbi:MAG: hypothetical protein ACLQNE_46820, partial [Thermoguttaceae bacterium]
PGGPGGDCGKCEIYVRGPTARSGQSFAPLGQAQRGRENVPTTPWATLLNRFAVRPFCYDRNENGPIVCTCIP